MISVYLYITTYRNKGHLLEKAHRDSLSSRQWSTHFGLHWL